MESIKVMHCADIHFDAPFKDVDEKQSKINKEELKEVFSNIINLCKEKNVDIFLLAGDIFDNLTIDKSTLSFIEDSFNKIENIDVFISPGNHDPYMMNSFYNLINWPDNVHIFSGALEKFYIERLNLNVWGAAFNNRYERQSLLKDFSYKDDKRNIMVIHGEISSGNENEYNPITVEEIEKSGMNYIALGHRHAFSGIKKAGRTYYAYSGCPQGRGFDELGDKGVVYGEINKDYSKFEFIKTSIRNYEEVNIDISMSKTYQDIKELIISSISENAREKNFYKIILNGELSNDFNLDEDVITEYIKDSFYFVKVVDKTRIEINIEDALRGKSVKSIFAKKLLKRLEECENEEEREIIELALKSGLNALSEGEVKLDDY